MKKILSFMLVLAMLLSVVSVQAFAAGNNNASSGGIHTIPDGASSIVINNTSYTVVRTLSELAAMTDGGHYVLANNIDCGGTALPSGSIKLDEGAVLDGNGYSITGFFTEETGTKIGRDGIFSLDKNQARNFTVRNLSFGSAEAPVKIANSIVGRSNDIADNVTTWENVHVYCEYTRLDGGNPAAFFGSALGTHTFKNCSVTVNVPDYIGAAASNVGGFIGTHTSGNLRFEGCATYGKLLSNNGSSAYIGYSCPTEDVTLTFKNCSNYMTVANKSGPAGGFIGYVHNKNGVNITLSFTDCYNEGSVTAVANSAGGFIGSDMGTTCTYTNCTNAGDVVSVRSTGGIVGDAASSTSSTVTFTDCLNRGALTGASTSGHVGGIIGDHNNATFENCVNIGALKAENAEDKEAGLGNIAGQVNTWSIKNSYAFGVLDGVNAERGVVFGIMKTQSGTTQGNFYVMNDKDDNLNAAETTGRLTLAQAVEKLNAAYGANTFMADGLSVVYAAPALRAVQDTDPSDANVQKIRFAATIDTLSYSKVGFKFDISYTDKDGNAVNDTNRYEYCSKVYTSLLSGDTAVSASALGGSYIYALALTEVPTDVGNITMTVTPVGVVTDAAGAETVYTGTAYTVVYNNGVCVSITEAN